MIEARQREDETECDMGVNGAFLCHFDDLMYYSVTLNVHRSVQTHVYTGSACMHVHRLLLGLGLLDERANIKEATGKNVAERVKKQNKTLTCNSNNNKEPLLISCINIFKSENHLHKMMTLLLFYCSTLPQCLM